MSRRTALLAAAVFAAGLALTAASALRIDERTRAAHAARFAEMSRGLVSDLGTSLDNQIALLGSVVALYQASDAVTRTEFETYVGSQILGGSYSAFDALAVVGDTATGDAPVVRQASGRLPLTVVVGQSLAARDPLAELAARARASGRAAFGASTLLATGAQRRLDVALPMPALRDAAGRTPVLLGALSLPRLARQALLHAPAPVGARLVVGEGMLASPVAFAAGEPGPPPERALVHVEPIHIGDLRGRMHTWMPRPAPAAGAVSLATLAVLLGGVLSALSALLVGSLARSADVERGRARDAERGRLDAEAERARLFDLALDPMCTASLEGYFLEVNPAWERMLGWTPEELVERPFLDFVHPDDREATLGAMADLDAGIDILRFQNRYRTRDGSYRWLRWTSHADVERGRIYAVAHDVTDREERERALEEAKRRAEEATRSKSEFLANMSHEIRTPLNAVIGLTGLLLEGDLSPQQSAQLHTVHSSGEHLLAIINDVLDLARIEAGHLELAEKPFDVESCMREALEMMRPAAEAKELELGHEIEGAPPVQLVGDETRLRQILLDLVGNAVKFTDRGRVTLRLRADLMPDGRWELRFRLSDTGVGIPKAAQADLFQPFRQVDGSMTRRHQGTGLGLVLSRRLCEAMDGSISVESEPGAGSTFHFRVRLAASPLPVRPRDVAAGTAKQASTGAEPGESEPSLGDTHPLAVLLVEDNPVNQAVAELMLERLGYHPDIAGDGAAAVRAVERAHYDLVLMDLQMPGMDGLEATRRILARRNGEAPRIVAMTAHALDEDRARCLEAGMSDHIAKPIQLTQLADTLRSTPQLARR